MVRASGPAPVATTLQRLVRLRHSSRAIFSTAGQSRAPSTRSARPFPRSWPLPRLYFAFAGVVVGPDAGISVFLSSFHAPYVLRLDRDVARGPSAKLTATSARPIHCFTLERARSRESRILAVRTGMGC
jgi:hypothetical protein